MAFYPKNFPVRKVVKWTLIIAVVVLVVPLGFAIIRGLWFLYSANPEYARSQSATELYYAYQEHKDRQRWTFNTGHPSYWPYLDCPPELQQSWGDWSSETLESNEWSPDIGSYILMAALITENQARHERFSIVRLTDTFSPTENVILAACIDASIFASLCADHVSSSAWENSSIDFDEFYSTYPAETDAMRAETNCRYYNAAMAAFQTENAE